MLVSKIETRAFAMGAPLSAFTIVPAILNFVSGELLCSALGLCTPRVAEECNRMSPSARNRNRVARNRSNMLTRLG